jgi:hypothetical protein
MFYSVTMQLMYLAHRGRPDILLAVSFWPVECRSISEDERLYNEH